MFENVSTICARYVNICNLCIILLLCIIVHKFFILKFVDAPGMLHSGRAEYLMQSQLDKFL